MSTTSLFGQSSVRIGAIIDNAPVLIVPEAILKSAFEEGYNDGTTMSQVELFDTLGLTFLIGYGFHADSGCSSIALGLETETENDTLYLLVTTGSSQDECRRYHSCTLCYLCKPSFNRDGEMIACDCTVRTEEGPCLFFCMIIAGHFTLPDFIYGVVSRL
jgi:hypothetical protein